MKIQWYVYLYAREMSRSEVRVKFHQRKSFFFPMKGIARERGILDDDDTFFLE